MMAARPNSPEAAAALLDRLGQAAAAGVTLPPDVAGWLITGIDRWRRGERLDRALGLTRGRGRRHPQTVARLQASNHALAELRERFFGDLRISEAAAEIAAQGGSYETSAWRFDQGKPAAAIADPKKRLLSEVLRTRGHFPGKRQVANVLQEMKSARFHFAETGASDPA